MRKESTYHKPIMATEVMDLLNPQSGGTYLDCTLGGGGHSELILKMSSPAGRVIGLDKDEEAIAYATNRLEPFRDRFTAIKTDYVNAPLALDILGIDKIDGALLDLGVSSHQLDDFDRGFSYRSKDSRLDMRMDKSQSLSAVEVVNGYSKDELCRIFTEYGEERFAKRIAEEIERRRVKKPIETCGELVEIIETTIPRKFQTDGHPAKRVFQAIRIEVNGEIENLREAVLKIFHRLNIGGRVCVITFHSLEDRIIKNLFKELETDCICDKSLPICVCDKMKEAEIITRKPVTAGKEELAINPRAASAKLRVAERCVPTKGGKGKRY